MRLSYYQTVMKNLYVITVVLYVILKNKCTTKQLRVLIEQLKINQTILMLDYYVLR